MPSNGTDPRIVELELAAQAEHGPATVCRRVATLEEAEALAPEHLVLLGESEARADEVRDAGAVFVGASSPVAAGDYATGGNHVLPTGGWARSVGGLGIETFLKPVTVQRLNGFSGEIDLTVEDLPPGVEAKTEVGKDPAKMTVKLTAQADAAGGGLFRIVGRTKSGPGTTHPATAPLPAPFDGAPAVRVDQLWLTVTRPAPPPAKAAKP